MSELTAGERAALNEAIEDSGEIWGLTDGLTAAVEGILTARLAAVEALAEQWNATPDYTPSDYDQGRVDQRHDMTTQLLEALTPAPPTGQESA